jgi:Spy/CpxP family protein refolding chaperone
MWTQGNGRLAAIGASMVLCAFVATTASAAADPASPSCAAGSNVMKTKHDTVKNSISNVR